MDVWWEMMNENMEQETQSKTTNNSNQADTQKQDIKITKARSRVTTNTPAFFNCMPTPTGGSVKSNIFKTLWEMKKRGLSESTL